MGVATSFIIIILQGLQTLWLMKVQNGDAHTLSSSSSFAKKSVFEGFQCLLPCSVFQILHKTTDISRPLYTGSYSKIMPPRKKPVGTAPVTRQSRITKENAIKIIESATKTKPRAPRVTKAAVTKAAVTKAAPPPSPPPPPPPPPPTRPES